MLEYLGIKGNLWNKFHQNQPTHISNLGNTFSDNDSLREYTLYHSFYFSHLEHFGRPLQVNLHIAS